MVLSNLNSDPETDQIPGQKPGMRARQRQEPFFQNDAVDDAIEQAAKDFNRIHEADEAATAESTKNKKTAGPAANQPNFIDPLVNAACLAAIVKLYNIEQIIFPEYLSNLALMHTAAQSATTLIVHGTDNTFTLTRDSIEADNDMVSPATALEMALLALNNPDIRKDGVDLQGNLRDRYMLQLAAQFIAPDLKITNPVTDEDIPADLKEIFAELAAEWAAYAALVESGVPAAAAPAQKAEEPELELEPKQEPEIDPLKQKMDTTSDGVVNAMRNARDIIDGRVKTETPVILSADEIANEAYRLSEMPGRETGLNDENWIAAEDNLKLIKEFDLTQEQVNAKAKEIWQTAGGVDDLGLSTFEDNQAAVKALAANKADITTNVATKRMTPNVKRQGDHKPTIA